MFLSPRAKFGTFQSAFQSVCEQHQSRLENQYKKPDCFSLLADLEENGKTRNFFSRQRGLKKPRVGTIFCWRLDGILVYNEGRQSWESRPNGFNVNRKKLREKKTMPINPGTFAEICFGAEEMALFSFLFPTACPESQLDFVSVTQGY